MRLMMESARRALRRTRRGELSWLLENEGEEGEGRGGRDVPDEIFVLPGLADAGDLEEEGAVVVEEVVDLPEEGAVATDADVLHERKYSINILK